MRTCSLFFAKNRAPLLLSLLLLVVGTPDAQAQAVSPDVNLTRPAAGVSNRLDVLRNAVEPMVALVYPHQTADRRPETTEAVERAIYEWEVFLLGLGIPYRVVSDEELGGKTLRNKRLAIMPVAEVLSRRQLETVEDFVGRGGALIASGRFGMFDTDGEPRGQNHFNRMFGALYLESMPEQEFGIFQSLEGGHALTDGLPMGYKLNLLPQEPLTAARPFTTDTLNLATSAVSLRDLRQDEGTREERRDWGRSYAVGRMFSYQPYEDRNADPFRTVTLAFYGDYKSGRFLWMRWHPQDVSRLVEQQAIYQGMLLNALAHLLRIPSVALRPWPNGHWSATAFAQLPTVGFDPGRYEPSLRNAVDVIEAANIPITFFLAADKVQVAPALQQRISSLGELALSADDDVALKKQLLSEQSTRLNEALDELQQNTGKRLRGLSPPGGFYDVNTIRAMYENDLRYLFVLPTQNSNAPAYFDWFARADYRESIERLLLPDPRRDMPVVNARVMDPESRDYLVGEVYDTTLVNGRLVYAPVSADGGVRQLDPTQPVDTRYGRAAFRLDEVTDDDSYTDIAPGQQVRYEGGQRYWDEGIYSADGGIRGGRRFLDQLEDRYRNELVGIDLDDDGIIDGYDSDGDGVIDAVDIDGDGKVDGTIDRLPSQVGEEELRNRLDNRFGSVTRTDRGTTLPSWVVTTEDKPDGRQEDPRLVEQAMQQEQNRRRWANTDRRRINIDRGGQGESFANRRQAEDLENDPTIWRSWDPNTALESDIRPLREDDDFDRIQRVGFRAEDASRLPSWVVTTEEKPILRDELGADEVTRAERLQRAQDAAATQTMINSLKLGRYTGMDRLDPRDRILTFPFNSPDDYLTIIKTGIGDDPEAQVRAYAQEFLDIHRGRGLYTLPFHAEVQTANVERAMVLAEVADYVRANNSWLATMRDMYEWWTLKSFVQIRMQEATEDNISFEVFNGSRQNVAGMSFDVRLHIPIDADDNVRMTGSQAQIERSADGQTITLIVPQVRTGVNRFSVIIDRE